MLFVFLNSVNRGGTEIVTLICMNAEQWALSGDEVIGRLPGIRISGHPHRVDLTCLCV